MRLYDIRQRGNTAEVESMSFASDKRHRDIVAGARYIAGYYLIEVAIDCFWRHDHIQ